MFDLQSFLASFTRALVQSRSPGRRNFAGPWVTSVGGTMKEYPEIGSKISGGGFSRHFERPAYQDVAVNAFLQKLQTGDPEEDPYSGLYKCV
jgi:hypothetical protein